VHALYRESTPVTTAADILDMFIISQHIVYYGYALKNPCVASINQKGKQANQAANKLGTIQAYKFQYFKRESVSEG
jgi:hypothetical protein